MFRLKWLWKYMGKKRHLFVLGMILSAVTSAMLHLSTALEQRWQDESLRALDEAVDALSEVESSDFATLENIL